MEEIEKSHQGIIWQLLITEKQFYAVTSQWSKRLFLEAWHSIREPNAINEHIYIPDIYKALGNPKWRFCGSFKHSFAFVSDFIAEEGYSILTETSSHKVF